MERPQGPLTPEPEHRDQAPGPRSHVTRTLFSEASTPEDKATKPATSKSRSPSARAQEDPTTSREVSVLGFHGADLPLVQLLGAI